MGRDEAVIREYIRHQEQEDRRIDQLNLMCNGPLQGAQGTAKRSRPAALSGSQYKAPGFAGGYLLEFAVALANWLGVATDLGPDFVYTSLESETEALVRFTRLSPGNWRVSAAHQDQEALDTFTTSELKGAALAYILELRSYLQPSLDILEYIEDRNAREDLRHKLE